MLRTAYRALCVYHRLRQTNELAGSSIFDLNPVLGWRDFGLGIHALELWSFGRRIGYFHPIVSLRLFIQSTGLK